MTRAKKKKKTHQNNPQTANQTKPSEIIFITKSANSTTLSKRYVVHNTDYYCYVAFVKS